MLSPGKNALGHATYERHRPEQTLLYQLVEKHYPALVTQLDAQGRILPTHGYFFGSATRINEAIFSTIALLFVIYLD